MSEWFYKDCNKDELVDLPNEMHEYLTNCFGNNGRYDSLSAIKIYDFLIEQGLGEVNFLSSEELLSVGFTGPLVDHFCNRADLKKQLGMLDEAIDDCNKAITLDMEWSNAYNTRGTIYYRKGDEFQELKDYEKAVEIDNNGAALTNLGNYYKQKGQFDIAIRYYDQAILLDQDSEVKCWAHTGRGDIFCTQGNYEKAMVEYEIAESLDQDYAWLHYGRGQCFEKQGLEEEALTDFSKAIQLDSDCWQAYWCRADLLTDREEFDAALEDYNQAISIKPNYAWLHYDRGQCFEKQGLEGEAIVDYTRAIELDLEFALAYESRGNLLKERGDFVKALEDYNRAILISPGEGWTYHLRGLCYKKQGLEEEALTDFSKAIQLDSDCWQAYWCRADLLTDREEFDAALEDYNQAISIKPNYAWLHYKRGDCHSSKAIFLKYSEKNGVDYTRVIIEYTQAIEDFSRANELDPGCAWYAKDLSYAYLSRAEIYKKENQFDLVIQDVSRYMELDRENDDLSNYYNCGGLLVDCEAYDKAVIAFNKFLEKYPDPLVVEDIYLTEALNWRGIAHCELGDYEQALADHNLAIKIAPDKPFGYCNLGDDYYAMGQYEKAIEYYTLSLKFDFEVSQIGSYTLSRRYKAYKAIGEDEKAQADLESNVW